MEEAGANRFALRLGIPPEARVRRVLEFIVSGHSNKEIGANLGVAENAVQKHVKVILGKLGVQDRTQAATAAVHRGLVSLWQPHTR